MTYVAAATTSFVDEANDFNDEAKQGTYYYRVAALSKTGIEGLASTAYPVVYAPK